jgi:predicted amidohydrolase YtcJ
MDNRRLLAGIALALLLGAAGAIGRAQQPLDVARDRPVADVVFTNGKIITVDEKFTIAQALAIRGNRIVAVGTNQQIAQLAGAATRRIDLHGRAVVPGLIDNHMHLLRAGTTWAREVRLDGVESRRQALDLVATRAKASPAGEWVYNIGGWSVDQFADSRNKFTREELDRLAPNNPVALQESYYRTYLNTRGLEAFGIRDGASDPADFPKGSIVRDGSGRATGIVEGGMGAVRAIAGKMPRVADQDLEASTLSMIKDMNRSGLTAFGVAGCDQALLPMYRKWEAQHQLNVRIFCIDGVGAGTPEQVERALPRIANIKLFQGSDFVDSVLYGESVYGPLHDPMFDSTSDPKPEQLTQWRRLATEVAKNRLPLHVHAELTHTIDAFLDQIESINKVYPIKNLRWMLAHFNQSNAAQLERMKRLGMYAAVHPWNVINGGIMHEIFGDDAYEQPPLATIQASGIMWGFGSDGSAANQYMPFITLNYAVTGKMTSGLKVMRQTIGREDALIAFTRRNAFFVFQEDNLGAIQPGKLADLVVLDRDYLTIPADQIKDIKPVLTMVDGRIVYDVSSANGTR